MPDRVVQLEIRAEGLLVDAFSYKDALDSLLALLREVDRSISIEAGGSGHTLRWWIQSTHSSDPTIELLAESTRDDLDVSAQVIRTTLESLEILQKSAARPPRLTYTGLERCLDLSNIIRRDGVSEISLKADHRQVPVTEQLGSHVSEIIGQRIEVLGSVQGELEMVTLRSRRYFNVYNIITGKATKCYYPESLFERVREALGHEVTVRGILRSFAHEEGQEMTEITELQIIEEEGALPTPDDIRGILPNITGGRPAEQYLKERWRGQQPS